MNADELKERVREFALYHFQKNGPPLGSIDLLLAPAGIHDAIALECLQLLAAVFDKPRNRTVFSNVCLVVPFDLDWPSTGNLEAILAQLPPDGATVTVHRTTDRSLATLATELLRFDCNTCAVCIHFDLYAGGDLTPVEHAGETLSGQPLRSRRSEVARAHQYKFCVTLLDSGRARATGSVLFISGHGPLNEACAMVSDVFDAISVVASASDSTPSFDLNEWVGRVQNGVRPTELIQAVIATGFDQHRAKQIVAHAYFRANRPKQAHEIFTELLKDSESVPAELLATASRVALDAADNERADRLVQLVVNDPMATPLAMRIAAQVARDLRSHDLMFDAASKLLAALPRDSLAICMMAECLVRRGRYEEALSALGPVALSTDDEGRYWLSVAKFRADPEIAGPASFIANAPPTFRQRAVADCIWIASEAQHWDNVNVAVEHIERGDPSAGEVVRALGGAISRWSLSSKGGATKGDIGSPRRWLESACGLMTRRPADGTNRTRLEDLADSGQLGEITFLALVVPLVAEPVRIARGPVLSGLQAGGESEARLFVEVFRKYLPNGEELVLAPKKLKFAVRSEDREAIVQGAIGCFETLWHRQTIDDSDVNFANLVLACVLDVVFSTSSDEEGRAALSVDLVHYVATSLTMHGRSQNARDLIETALHIAETARSEAVAGDAWIAYADICIRSHQPAAGLLSLAVAGKCLAGDPGRVSRYHAYAARALRDVGLVGLAQRHVEVAESVSQQDPEATNSDQLRGLRWSISLRVLTEAAQKRPLNPSEEGDLKRVIDETSAALAPAGETVDSRVAPATHLHAAITLSEELGLPHNTESARSQLLRVGRSLPPHVERAMTDVPTLVDLLEVATATVSPRFRADVATDATTLRVLARRYLARDDTPVSERAAALEALSDLEFAFAKGEQSAVSDRVRQSLTTQLFESALRDRDVLGFTDVLRQTANPRNMHALLQALSRPDAHLANIEAASSEGTLIEAATVVDEHLRALRVLDGVATWTVEREDQFDAEKLPLFEARYPYDFHSLRDHGVTAESAVRNIMRPFAVSAPDRATALRCVVPESHLVAIPANLQLVGDAFAGDSQPTCQAPSLSWLANAYRNREHRPTLTATLWALKEDASNWLAPIGVGAEQLEDGLAAYASVVRNAELSEISATSVTWFLGHGGLGVDSRHFSGVSDDVGTAYRSDELVDACSGATLVILLVCSGGRTTRGLFAEKMHGLPYQLLRNGTRAVVASPWPLDVLVAASWAPVFAKQLATGDTVANSVFAANRSLLDRPPKDRLAMHVYGDPWLRFKQ